MRDHELYATMLGLTAPWAVERVEVDVPGGVVHVWLARAEGAPAQCPECQATCTVYDHRDREWRHLDTCQLQTRLHARVPRVDCPTHGVLQSPVSWATPGSKFTLLFERLAIDWLHAAAVAAVARQLHLSWDAVWGIERRAVARGLARRETLTLRYVGVDEKSFQRRHDYVTVVSDLDEARVLFVADDRKQESLEAFWALGLTDAQRTALEGIAMDMWAPYIQATRARVPDAETKIVFDRFHCAKHLNEGVDRVRRAEHRDLRAAGIPG
jgi:transposase